MYDLKKAISFIFIVALQRVYSTISIDLIQKYAKKATTNEQKRLLNKILGSIFIHLYNSIVLKGLNLKGINLSNAHFEYCNLIITNLNLATLTNTLFDYCYFKNTLFLDRFKVDNYTNNAEWLRRYSRAEEPEREKLNQIFKRMYLFLGSATLNNLDLSKINLEVMVLKKANLQNTNLAQASLPRDKWGLLEAKLQGATLPDGHKVPFYQDDNKILQFYIHIHDFKEKEAINQVIDLIGLCIDGDYSGQNLSGIKLKQNIFIDDDAKFQGANLTHAKIKINK